MKANYKIFKRHNSKSGVSLIELIVVLAIIGIVIMIASSSDIFGLNTFRKAEENSKNQYETRMASDFITKHIRYADSLLPLTSPQTSSPSADGYNYIYFEGGELFYYKDGLSIPVPGTEDVNDYTITFTANNYNLAYVVGKIGSNKYDLSSDVDILNLKSKISWSSPYGVKYKFTNASNVEIPLTIEGVEDVVLSINQYSTFTYPNLLAHMSDGSDQLVSADSWSQTINTTIAGTQISYGHVPGWGADVKLTVNITPALSPNYVENPVTINILTGVDYTLPSTVRATINELEQMLAVSWGSFSPAFNKDLTGTYTVVGTTSISPVAGDITLVVNVNPASIIGYVYDTVSINRLVNEGYSPLSSVPVILDNESQSDSPVISWNPNPAYDNLIAGVYTAVGSIADYSGEFTLKTYVYPVIQSPITIQQFKNNGTLPDIDTSSFLSVNEGPYNWILAGTAKDVKITLSPISGTIVVKSNGVTVNLDNKISIPNDGKIYLEFIVTSLGAEKTQKTYTVNLTKP